MRNVFFLTAIAAATAAAQASDCQTEPNGNCMQATDIATKCVGAWGQHNSTWAMVQNLKCHYYDGAFFSALQGCIDCKEGRKQFGHDPTAAKRHSKTHDKVRDLYLTNPEDKELPFDLNTKRAQLESSPDNSTWKQTYMSFEPTYKTLEQVKARLDELEKTYPQPKNDSSADTGAAETNTDDFTVEFCGSVQEFQLKVENGTVVFLGMYVVKAVYKKSKAGLDFIYDQTIVRVDGGADREAKDGDENLVETDKVKLTLSQWTLYVSAKNGKSLTESRAAGPKEQKLVEQKASGKVDAVEAGKELVKVSPVKAGTLQLQNTTIEKVVESAKGGSGNTNATKSMAKPGSAGPACKRRRARSATTKAA